MVTSKKKIGIKINTIFMSSHMKGELFQQWGAIP